MCQSCVDDGLLTQQTYDVLEAVCVAYPWIEWTGELHCVFADSNVRDSDLRPAFDLVTWLLHMSPRQFIEYAQSHSALLDADNLPQLLQSLEAAQQVLAYLLTVPEDER